MHKYKRTTSAAVGPAFVNPFVTGSSIVPATSKKVAKISIK